MPNLRRKTWTTTTPANVEDAQYWEDHLISDEAAQKAAGAVQSVNNTLPDENGNINITPSPLGPTVVDSLNSTSATDALSANQGHALKDLVDTLTEDTQELKYRVGILSAKVPYYVANATIPRKKTLSSAELTEARARAAEQDYKTVVPGDIIIGPNTGSEYYLAKCWGRKGMGDSQPTGGAALTPNLMLMLYKPHGITRLWAGYGTADKSWRVSANDLGRCPWNAAADVDPTDSEAVGTNSTNITRQYNGTNVSGYMGSFIRKMLDERLLVDCFEADFGASNILPYRARLGNTIKTDSPSGGHPAWNGLTNNAAWYTRKLDLPSEPELFGSIIWSGSGFDVGIQNEQLPFLQLGDIDLFFPRFDIWTLGVASSSYACFRSYDGYASYGGAGIVRWACPLGCIS